MDNSGRRSTGENLTSDSILNLDEVNDDLYDGASKASGGHQNCRKSDCKHCSGKKPGHQNSCSCNLPKGSRQLPMDRSGGSNAQARLSGAGPSNRGVNRPLNDLSGPQANSSANDAANRTQEAYNNSMRFCEKLLELIEKRTRVLQDMTFGSESSENISDIRPPAGMGGMQSFASDSVGNASRVSQRSASRSRSGSGPLSSSRNASAGQRTSEIIHISDGGQEPSLGRLSVSRISGTAPSERSASVGQRTSEIIHISDDPGSSLGLLNESRMSGSNVSRPFSSRQDGRTSEIIHISDGNESSLGVLNLSGVSEPNASRQQSGNRNSMGGNYGRLDDISDITLDNSVNSRRARHSAPGGGIPSYDRQGNISQRSAPARFDYRSLRQPDIDNISHSDSRNISQISFPDDSKIGMLKFIEDISHLTMVDLPVPDSIECDNEDKIVVIKNPDYEDWKINIKLSSKDAAEAGPSKRTICSFRKSNASDKSKKSEPKKSDPKKDESKKDESKKEEPKKEEPKKEEKNKGCGKRSKTAEKAVQTDPVVILSMDMDEKQFEERDGGPPPRPEPEPVAGPSGIPRRQSMIPQRGQANAKKSFLPKIVRVPVKENVPAPKPSPPKKKGNPKNQKKNNKKK